MMLEPYIKYAMHVVTLILYLPSVSPLYWLSGLRANSKSLLLLLKYSVVCAVLFRLFGTVDLFNKLQTQKK